MEHLHLLSEPLVSLPAVVGHDEEFSSLAAVLREGPFDVSSEPAAACRPPVEWSPVMDHRDAMIAALELQRDAGGPTGGSGAGRISDSCG